MTNHKVTQSTSYVKTKLIMSLPYWSFAVGQSLGTKMPCGWHERNAMGGDKWTWCELFVRLVPAWRFCTMQLISCKETFLEPWAVSFTRFHSIFLENADWGNKSKSLSTYVKRQRSWIFFPQRGGAFKFWWGRAIKYTALSKEKKKMLFPLRLCWWKKKTKKTKKKLGKGNRQENQCRTISRWKHSCSKKWHIPAPSQR